MVASVRSRMYSQSQRPFESAFFWFHLQGVNDLIEKVSRRDEREEDLPYGSIFADRKGK